MAGEKKMDCVILGLLNHEPKTGYQIKKRIDTTLKFFWGASFGSIYPTLNGLVRDGMVTKYEARENGRKKIVYTITPAGREHLKAWLCLPVEKDELRCETLLKLFFGSEIGEDGTIKHVVNFENKIRNELPLLQKAANRLKEIEDTDEAHRYYLFTALFGVKVYGACLEWCEEVKQALEERRKTK
jgi:DNA-binding PadR family transcriptional regulator